MNRVATSSLRQRAVAGGRWTALSGIIGVVVQLGQLALLGRLLDPTDFGLMAMLSVIIGVFGLLADLGVGNFIVQTRSFTGKQLGGLLVLCGGTSMLLGTTVVLISPWVAAYYRTPGLESLLPAMAFIIAVTAIGQIYFSLLQREMRFRAIAVGEVLSNLSGLTVSVALALRGNGVWALIIGQWVATAARTSCYWVASKSILRPELSSRFSELHACLRFGSFQIGERLLNYAGWNIDKFIVGRMLGDSALGIYSVAYQLVMRPFAILNPIFTRVALPLLARIQNDDPRLRQGYLQLSRTIAAISFPVYVAMIVCSEAIILLLLGSKWAEGANLLSTLAVLGFVFALGNPIGTLLLAKGRADLGLYYNVVALIVYSIFIFIGSHFGLQGVATGFIFAAAFILSPLDFLLRWYLIRMSALEYIRAVGKIVLAAALSIGVASAGDHLVNPAGGMMMLALLKGIVALTTYAILIWIFEKELVKETYRLIGQQ